MIDEVRRVEYEAVVSAIGSWAEARTDVRAVAVVGSWARDRARMDSDLDLVILTTDDTRLLDEDTWICQALPMDGAVVRRQDWGALTERRVRLPSGFEVELGLVSISWASTAPIDPGTARVVRDGWRAVVDPDGLLARLRAAVHAAP